MKLKKYFTLRLLKVFVLFFLMVTFVSAADMTSTNFIIRDPVVGTGGGYGTSTNFQLISSGDTTTIGRGSSASFLSRYGFLYFPYADAAVLTATPNGADADLTWTASSAGLGWTVAGYNTGKASVSGGPYTYTDVGNTTSYTYENLVPGFYCFVVETYDALDYVIATSNEDCITIESVLVFDLDTDVDDIETNAPYSVSLGTITTTDTRASGTTDNVEMIIVESNTNGPGGLVVTVRNANGASGLLSTSVPADGIPSADGVMADGTANYGICIITATLAGFTAGSGFDGTCATNSETNDVEGLSTTPEEILNSGGVPIASGHAEISVNGAVSAVTPAHSDYADTLTFIVTGTF